MRYSGPETNTGPYLVYEKFELGIFHCPCSLLGVSDGRVISNEYRTQTVRFCSYQPHVLLTLLNWSTTMKPLNALPKFENHFVVKTVRFQVQLEADGYFFAQEVFEFATAASRASRYQLAIFESDFTNLNSKTLVGLRPNPIFSTKLRRLRILADAEQANFLRKNLF